MGRGFSKDISGDRFHIITLGCKVNQCESASFERELVSSGWTPAESGQDAHVVIINTCTVTHNASAQSRQAIRQAIKANPSALIIVTGCYAQVYPQDISKIEGVHIIAGNTMKHKLTTLIRNSNLWGSPEMLIGEFNHGVPFYPETPPYTSTRTRAFLKIQDGCDSFCSYCIVPYARGPARSMPLKKVISILKSLANEGYKEVVITGIHLGRYGKDMEDGTSLKNLLKEIEKHRLPIRIRLSSLEPQEIDRELIEMVANTEWLCPHFHIPLQSGDNHILSLMNRRYKREDFIALILSIRKIMPYAAIGVDVMAGFPGESDSAFENTLNLLKGLPISYLHVFPYSPREGTPAEKFPSKVSPEIIKKRTSILRKLGKQKRDEFSISCIDLELEVLSLGAHDKFPGYSKGLSDNYLSIIFPSNRPLENTLLKIHIDRKIDDYLEGHISEL